MVAPDALALVIRQRGGPNLMVHTRGIAGIIASRACEEAVTVMGRFALGRGETDVDGTGDIHPKFAHDKLLVMNGRYAVVYRLVHKVWVMAVAETHMDSLVPVRLVETATKGLVTTCQILEVDNDVVARNYQEVHFMMSAILKYQGANLPKAQTEALANIYSFIADTRDKKSRAANESSKRLPSVRAEKPILTNFNGGSQNFDIVLPNDFKQLQKTDGISFPSEAPFDFGMLASPSKPLQQQQQSQVEFSFEDVMPTVPKPVSTTPASEPQTFSGLDDLLGPPKPAKTAPAQDTSFDFLFADAKPVVPSVQQSAVVPAPPVSPLSAPSPVAKPPAPQQSSWFDFNSDVKQTPVHASSTPVSQTSPQRPWPLLFLVEKWTGSFEGSACVKSTAIGEVSLRKQLWKSVAGKDIRFKLSYPAAQSDMSRGLRSVMKCVKCHAARTSVVQDGVLSAKIQPAQTPFLKYSLLPGMYDPPIRVCVTSAMTLIGDAKKCAILLIHIATNARNKSAASGSVFAWLPRPFGPPTYTRPRSVFSKNQNCLKWSLHNMQPNQNIMLKAILPTPDCVDDDIAKLIRVSVNCLGKPGSTFSNLSLSQEFVPGTHILSETPGVALWTATVTARP